MSTKSSEHNGTFIERQVQTATTEAERAQALAALRAITANVNLDEVSTTQIDVAFREYVTEEEAVAGRTIKRRRATVRIARIDPFVPTALFHQVMDRQDALSKKYNGARPPQAEGARIMAEAVLSVWQRSEEDMTMERLCEGIDTPRMMTLFHRFFGSMTAAIPPSGA